MSFEELNELFDAEGLVILVFKECESAHSACGVEAVHFYDDVLSSGVFYRNGRVCLLSVGNALIDEGVDKYTLYLGDPVAVYPEIFTVRICTCPVIAVEGDIGRSTE